MHLLAYNGSMKTLQIPGARHVLGWRHTLSDAAWAGIDAFLPRATYMEAFSPAREVVLDAFEMRTEPVDVEALLEDVDDATLDGIETVEALCDVVDGLLRPTGWRLPTEDELEAALGGGLFAWGDHLPEGSPYAAGAFELHQRPTPSGLSMPSDTYQVELVRAAFKMSDGGSAVCGGYPWPVAWLTLSPCARVPDELLEDLFVWLENATIHPIRLG